MSNSALVTYTNLSPNRTSPRTGKIDTVTVHCIVGQWTAKQGCDYFAQPSAKASANYVVGCDGSIGLCVDEGDRAWTTGGTLKVNGETGAMNDHHAVTIEVASDTTSPYAVTDAAYAALIKLVADIARRNGLGTLKWKADKTLVGQPDKQNMTVHRWFAVKACPGDYLFDRMGDIAQKANAINFPPAAQGGREGSDETVSEPIVNNTPADWAKSAWDKAMADGIMDGTRPEDPITRQEVAVILDRCGLLEEGEEK